MQNIFFLALLAITFSCKTSNNTGVSSSVQVSPADYSKFITAANLKTHLYIIASDEMQGRDTGTEGQKMAAEYLRDFYIENKIASPKGSDNYYQFIPSSYFKKGDKVKDSENVVAYIEGSEHPNEIIVITAHYDHVGVDEDGNVFNGADDDGSGTVAILEIAKAFQKAKENGNGPKRSILFLHVTAEEIGLLGSKYYVENPLFPLANTVANLNIDMIGRIDPNKAETPNYIYLIGSDKLSQELHNVSEQVNNTYVNIEIDYKYNDENDPNRFYYRSDHYNFVKHNIPAIFYFNGVHADYHKITDTPDKIEYDLLETRAKLIFHTAWELANRKDRIALDINK